MRHHPIPAPAALALAMALALTAASGAAAQGTSRNAGPSAQDRAYSSDSTDFVVGKRVHLRSTKTYIGIIRAVDEHHAFPADRFPRARMKAVLIERRDGPLGWVPVERITHIYVVR